jgi:predicted acetyltransferase
VEIRRARAEEILAGIAPVSHYFGSTPTEETAARFSRVLRPERMHVAEEGGAIVGGASAFEFQLTVPGAVVPAAGVTIVGVFPTHRRRGILTGLMRVQLDDVHDRGEPLAALWASEGGIYGRFGYGLAALCGDIDIDLDHARFRAPVEGHGVLRLLPLAEALELVPRVYAQVAPEIPGMFVRTREWWEARVFHDSEDRREGAGELVHCVYEEDGEPLGYALYRLKFGFEAGSSAGEVHVIEALGATPRATAAVWRFLLDIDWMATLQSWGLPVDHPLFLLLEEPRRMRFRIGDSLWVRLVDVGAALAARELEGDLVVEVADSFCRWNDGRYSLDGESTSARADLRLDVSDLASVYLGGFTFVQQLRAGRVEELTPGAVSQADAAFRTDRAPWCPEVF